MTPSQYQEALVQRALSQSTLGRPLTITPPPGGGDYWYTVIATEHDSSGRKIPIRYGWSETTPGNDATGAGYEHACADHNLCNPTVLERLFSDNTPISSSGSRYVYDVYIVDDDLDIDLIVQGSQSQLKTGWQGEATPDGAPFGLVTAFCENYTNCPEAINDI
jgi:hypothetical protein